jgi:hypothetical protein
MARALDDVVVAAGLRHDDVVAFVRAVGEAARASVRPVNAPAAVARQVRARAAAVLGREVTGRATLRERGALGARVRRRRARGARARAALVVGAVLAALGLGTAFGWRTGGSGPRGGAVAAATRPAPRPAARASVERER